jgi:hypothetical protein
LAGGVWILARLAGGTKLDVSAQLSSAASGDIGQSPAVRGEQLLPRASQGGWAVTAHDVRPFEPGLSGGSLEPFGYVLVAEAVLTGSRVLAMYAGQVLAFFHLFVMVYEEPALRLQFGKECEAYCRAVPSWWVRREPYQPEQGTT